MRMDPEALLYFIVALAVGNGLTLHQCVTGSGANAIPQDLKDIIMVVLLIDLLILLLAVFMLSKFSRRGSGTIVYK